MMRLFFNQRVEFPLVRRYEGSIDRTVKEDSAANKRGRRRAEIDAETGLESRLVAKTDKHNRQSKRTAWTSGEEGALAFVWMVQECR